MKKRKKKINILGYNYKIEYPCDEATMYNPARINFSKHIIQIANDQIGEEDISAILHEVFEGIDHHLSLQLDHGTIVRLEAGFFQVLTQNGVDLSPLLWEK